MVSHDQFEAFVQGKELPQDIVDEIDRALDDPTSEVSQWCREYARITRRMFDPEDTVLDEARGEDGGK